MRRLEKSYLFFLLLPSILSAGFLSEGYYLWQAKRALQKKEYLKAFEAYRKIRPQNDRLLYNEANLLYRLGNYKEALSLYRQILDPELQGWRLYNMANCYVKLKNYPKAKIYYEAASNYLANDSDLSYNLKKIQARLREQALEDALKGLKKGQKSVCKLERLPYGVRRGYFQGKSFGDDFESNQTLFEARYSDLLLKQANIASVRAPRSDANAEELGDEIKRNILRGAKISTKSLESKYYEHKLKLKPFRSLLVPLDIPKRELENANR